MRILITGGAGYIGSHMVKMLARRGHAPVTFDDLSTGNRAAVIAGEFELGSLGDRARLAEVFKKHAFDAVMHFAAFVQVGESVALRYFNAAEADPEGELGPRHEPITHLIPIVLQAACGRRPLVEIYGNDYPTPDGTGVRDYIHVWDLCDAHLAALEHLAQGGEGGPFNLGNGAGYSVLQVIEAAERVTAHAIARKVVGRRPGDPAQIVADATRAVEILKWRPQYSDLATIIHHAWAWEQSRTRAGPKLDSR